MESYDVVVVGGGPAGLSGALTLARARRSVLVIDDGDPRNAASEGVHNYLGAEGVAPAELAARGRREAAGYGASFLDGRADAATRTDDGFVVVLAEGTEVRARRLLVAGGLTDELPAVEGVASRWGREVLHCPYCHGWEVRDRAIAVLSTGPFAGHQAQLFRQWSDDVTLLTHTGPAPTQDERRALAARGIRVVGGEVAALEDGDDGVGRAAVRLRSGEVVVCDAVVVGPRFTARSALLPSLGLEPAVAEHEGHALGASFPAGPTGETTVPGVYLAGNVTDIRAGVISAAAAGFQVATMINSSLVDEEIAAAVAPHTMPPTENADGTPRDPEEFWEELYRRSQRRWSGDVNPVLADVAGPLGPGAVLDLGCGEGADAVWLAARGWDVTAVDVAPTAVARTRHHAADAGVGDRVRAEHHDLGATLPDGTFDLVSAQFLQSPLSLPRSDVLRRVAERVRPGGLLLVVDHGSAPSWSWAHEGHAFATPQEIADEIALDPGEWTHERVETRERVARGPDGEQATVLDAVVALRRAG